MSHNRSNKPTFGLLCHECKVTEMIDVMKEVHQEAKERGIDDVWVWFNEVNNLTIIDYDPEKDGEKGRSIGCIYFNGPPSIDWFPHEFIYGDECDDIDE